MSITNEPERLIEKENGKFYATDYTGYVVTEISSKFDFPLINCIEKLYEYEEFEDTEGYWIEYNEHPQIRGRCSLCGWEAHLYEDDVLGMSYCPNCGHKMKGIIDEEDLLEREPLKK